MSHNKIKTMPKNWPVPRKGKTFIVKTKSNNGIPLLVVLRDILKIVQNRKEVKKAIHQKNILINNREARDERTSMTLFDTLTLVPSKKNYKISISENGKFKVEEIDVKSSNNKIAKITNKKILSGKKIQINLSDGRNFLSELECKTNDSVLINFKDKKIEKCLPLKEKAKVMIFAGKHSGEEGIIKELIPERKMAIVNNGDEEVNILIKQLMVIE